MYKALSSVGRRKTGGRILTHIHTQTSFMAEALLQVNIKHGGVEDGCGVEWMDGVR